MSDRHSLIFHALSRCLSDKLNDTTGLGDLALSLGADVSRANDDRDLGETACVELVFWLSSESVTNNKNPYLCL